MRILPTPGRFFFLVIVVLTCVLCVGYLIFHLQWIIAYFIFQYRLCSYVVKLDAGKQHRYCSLRFFIFFYYILFWLTIKECLWHTVNVVYSTHYITYILRVFGKHNKSSCVRNQRYPQHSNFDYIKKRNLFLGLCFNILVGSMFLE